MTLAEETDFLLEARRLIQDADLAFLGRRHPSPDVVDEVRARHREAAVLISRVLESKGVQP